jgi:hypothetical protein
MHILFRCVGRDLSVYWVAKLSFVHAGEFALQARNKHHDCPVKTSPKWTLCYNQN